MNKLDIGVDPDVDKHGVAIYSNGKLSELLNLNTLELYDLIKPMVGAADIVLHVENVKGIKAVWHNKGGNKKSFGGTSQNVGKNKHAQTCIEQLAAHLDIPIKLYKPCSHWKDTSQKALFERATGWTGSSNKDNRSAAYFGLLGCRNG